jgi:hypothetical protein
LTLFSITFIVVKKAFDISQRIYFIKKIKEQEKKKIQKEGGREMSNNAVCSLLTG